jgi:hypothetical protein
MHAPRLRTLTLRVWIALAFAAGCGDSTGPPVSRMTVLSGAGMSDTVFTPLPDPLVVLVRDETGMPALGVPVRFEVLPPPFPSNTRGAFLYITPDRQAGFVFIDTTDVNGEARVYIRLGTLAGTAQVVADAPSLALSTTATYTVLPGSARSVRVVPSDSAMYAGHGYNLRAAVVDWWGNARPDAVTYTATAPATVDVDAAGRITGQAIGRGAIIVAGGTFRDTARVSVVPEGVIAAHKLHVVTGDTAAVIFVGLDGSGYEERPVVYWANPHPDWAPSGDAIVMEDGGDDLREEGNRLVILRRGESSWVPLGSNTGPGGRFYPQYSPDGTWIYFAERNLELWRLRNDGSGAERIGPPTTGYSHDTKPSISPGGDRLVFTTNRVCCSTSLMVLHLESRAIDTLRSDTGANVYGVFGDSPRWSPVDDNRIAYLNERVWLTSADGKTQQALTPQGKRYFGGIDWSPDGRWIIARSFSDGLLHLIEVSTGLTLPLGFTGRLVSPAWRSR